MGCIKFLLCCIKLVLEGIHIIFIYLFLTCPQGLRLLKHFFVQVEYQWKLWLLLINSLLFEDYPSGIILSIFGVEQCWGRSRPTLQDKAKPTAIFLLCFSFPYKPPCLLFEMGSSIFKIQLIHRQGRWKNEKAFAVSSGRKKRISSEKGS